MPPDDLHDFTRRSVALQNQAKTVFVRGGGPAIIVMHEIPGLTPGVARLCRWISDAGFTVYAPVLFGTPGKPPDGLSKLAAITRVCISREFRVFQANQSSPVVDWLKLLAAQALQECGGAGVGVLGLCLTGNFALAMAVEPFVLAPVMGEPGLPFGNAAGMHISPEDLATVQQRVQKEGLIVRGYRFDGDTICKQVRFNSFDNALKPGFVQDILPDACANPEGHKPPHSVFTGDLIDRPGEKTRHKVDEVIAFFKQKLAAKAAVSNS